MQVEEGLCDGAVLYHAHVSKTKAEVSAQQAAKDEAARIKSQRRQQQEENVRRKEVSCVCCLLDSAGQVCGMDASVSALGRSVFWRWQ